MSHYKIEIAPPRQNTDDLQQSLERFNNKYLCVIETGNCASITDNAMGHTAFQATELIKELNLPVPKGKVMVHINTFHSKDNLDEILKDCIELNISEILVISGDGSARLPKLQPKDFQVDTAAVTSVELIKYIKEAYPNKFKVGAAFNQYEPAEHEFEKLGKKLSAGADFLITQPVINENEAIEKLLKMSPVPVIIEAWMSKNIHLLSDCIGYDLGESSEFDPISELYKLQGKYAQCNMYLALLTLKQFPKLFTA